ncbi:MAG: hypothetical protein HS101_19595 [Planctomycetia bacterium]|nr:hypothetical protein [Planctomycetia bacterium]
MSDGKSFRYTCIVLLGSRLLPEAAQRFLFQGESAREFCKQTSAETAGCHGTGDCALYTWASAELGVLGETGASKKLREAVVRDRALTTVDAAWSISALAASLTAGAGHDELRIAFERLVAGYSRPGKLFRHWTSADAAPWYRSHVGCFADQIYSIQALSRYYSATGDTVALEIAAECADQIVRLQGPEGQWWWHYDVRQGSVIEGYPVYTVHQDSMAPMGLFELYEAGGPDHRSAIDLGLRWLEEKQETESSLVKEDSMLIWRSVRRSDPAKTVRRVRAVVSYFLPSARLGFLDAAFPPGQVDHEDRPYHLGWILYAWLGQS